MKDYPLSFSKKNKVDAHDIYARSHDKVWMVCKYGHESLLRADTVAVDKYGCKYCSLNTIEKGINDLTFSAYNYWVNFVELRGIEKISDVRYIKSRFVEYHCPFCGTVSYLATSDIPFYSYKMSPCCNAYSKLYIIPLCIYNNTIIYSVNIRDIWYLCASSVSNLDPLLSKAKLNINCIASLEDEFSELIPPPMVTTSRNSCYSIPVKDLGKDSITVYYDRSHALKAIEMLSKQRLGLKDTLNYLESSSVGTEEPLVDIYLTDLAERVAGILKQRGYRIVREDRRLPIRPTFTLGGDTAVKFTKELSLLDGWNVHYYSVSNVSGADIEVPTAVKQSLLEEFCESVVDKLISITGVKTYSVYLQDFKNILNNLVHVFNHCGGFTNRTLVIQGTEDGRVLFKVDYTDIIVDVDFNKKNFVSVSGRYAHLHGNFFESAFFLNALKDAIARILNYYKLPLRQISFPSNIEYFKSIRIIRDFSNSGEVSITIQKEKFKS